MKRVKLLLGEMPREKLFKRGVSALSDAELLAIFLRTGVAGCSVVQLSEQLLSQFGSLTALIQAPLEQICQHKGMGRAKTAQLQAIMELARRTLAERWQRPDCFDSTSHAKEYVATQLLGECNEVFAICLLDSQHRLIRFQRLFQGSIGQSAVYPRVIVQAALASHAAAVILCHNHPSGVTEPSLADLHITERIQQALALIDVVVLDHLIVGKGKVSSLAEQGQL